MRYFFDFTSGGLYFAALCPVLCSFTRQRQAVRSLSTSKPVKVFGGDVVQGRTPVCFANDDTHQLSVCYDTEPDGIIHQVEQVMLTDAALNPFFTA